MSKQAFYLQAKVQTRQANCKYRLFKKNIEKNDKIMLYSHIQYIDQ